MDRKLVLSNTAPMEVHHHAHPGRKTFRHYLFEFFMLFLAVFCGFLAEYFLEHTIEHQREHQFVESMIKDLGDDTVRISNTYEFNKKQLRGLDSLLRILYSHPTNPDTVDKAFRLYRNFALNYDRVIFNTRTLTQLKNSGSMRLIRKQAVSDSIMSYDAGIQNTELQFEVVKDSWRDESSFSYQLFNLAGIYLEGQINPNKHWQFISKDEALMNAYNSRLLMFAAVIRGYTAIITQQKKMAQRLMHFLKEQYNID